MDLQSNIQQKKPYPEVMRKHHILIVEDEKSIRDMVYFALNSEGYEIDEAVDGKEATEKLALPSTSLFIKRDF